MEKLLFFRKITILGAVNAPLGLAAAFEAVMEMKAETAMDQIDKQILAQLQVNAAQPVADIARKVPFQPNPATIGRGLHRL